MNNKQIIINSNDNITKIEVQENCSLFVFFNEITSKLPSEVANSLNMNSLFNEIIEVDKKVIYIIKKDNKTYNISFNKNSVNNDYCISGLFITEKEELKKGYVEKSLQLLPDLKYRATQKNVNYNYKGNSFKIYMNDKDELMKFITNKVDKNNPNSYIPSKKQAFRMVNDLLLNLEEIDGINDIIPLDYIYSYVGVVPKNSYNPIITDGHVTLSFNKKINGFQVIMNKTKEVIGNISLEDENQKSYLYKDYENEHLEARTKKLFDSILENTTTNSENTTSKKFVYKK